MNRHPLIQPAELQALMQARGAGVVVLDCSFDLGRPDAGLESYRARHVPGAIHVHLDRDLCAPMTGRNGRHPLPTREAFVERLAQWGVDDDSTVVVVDANGGMYAARAWWMLRWVGHADVALLDGGTGAWVAAGGAVEQADPPPRPRGRVTLRPSLAAVVEREALLAGLGQPTRLLVDARAPDRFRGENETLDPVGGRIPGARNRFFKDNLAPDGRFKPAPQLRAEFDAVTGGRPADELVLYCGSGVTACVDLLALELAGRHGAALYAGSWSEWCAWPGAPVGTGAP
ncbi:MAG: sulfurtransferase [Rubrivivax sp.]